MRAAWLAAGVLALGPGPAWAGDFAVPTAVFDIELYDTSGEPRRAAHDRRLAMLSAELRTALDALPAYRVVPLGDAVAGLPRPLHACEGCEMAAAGAAGAAWAVTGVVHKVSTLIQSIRITVRDVARGRILRRVTAGVRGDTDEAWRRGVGYLVRNRLARPAEP